MKQLVDKTINEYSKTRDTANLIRASCSYVMMICLREYKLFNEFFDLDLTLKKSLLTTKVTSSKKRRRRTNSSSVQPRLSNMSSTTTTGSTPGITPGRSPGSRSPRSPSAGPAQYTYADIKGAGMEEDDDVNIISGSKRISTLIKDLCALLYSYLRPFIIQTSSMQILCDVIHILQGEIQEHMQLRNRTMQSIGIDEEDEDGELVGSEDMDSNIPEFDRTIVRIIEDAQERLVFRTQIHLRDEVQNYEVKEKDLDYYALLKNIYEPTKSQEDEQTVDGGDGRDDENDGNDQDKDEDKEEDKEKEEDDDKNKLLMSRYSDWSPLLEKTLSLLSKIYPVLNHSVFEFLAYESVSCCVTSLIELARKLAHKSSSVHGHLFLIKHLLILREQISPFDVDFSIEETTLDFGHMTQYLSNLVSSANKYSLVSLLQNAIPTVGKHQLNSKKSMESVLKKGCEAFIETQTNLLIGPLISLISKYKQQTAIANLRKQAKEKEKKIHPLQQLNEGPIESDDDDGDEKKDTANKPEISVDKRQEILTELNAILDSFHDNLILRVNELMDLMNLYLQNELTQRILLKPIISNIQSAFIQLRKIVIETESQNAVKLTICDNISDQLQAIVNKSSR